MCLSKFFLALLFFGLTAYGAFVNAIPAFPLTMLFIFAFLVWCFNCKGCLVKPNIRVLLFFVVFSLGILFQLHFLGFHNIKYGVMAHASNRIMEPCYFNFDKILSGLILLYFYKNILVFSRENFIKTFLYSLLGIFIVISIALKMQFIAFDFKIHDSILLWSIRNFFAVALCEEILFRGFLLENLNSLFASRFSATIASALSLIISSIIFGCVYFKSGSNMMFLAGVAGVFYGLVYIKTKNVFYSAFTHSLLNLTHFIFFSYPYLIK